MSKPFSHQLRVRWNEADPQGVVFNANYLIYADVAGTEYFRALGADASNIEDFLQLYVVDAHLAFKSPAKPDDLITCQVTPTRVGNSSLQLTITITRDDTKLTVITMTYVRAHNGQSAPLSEAFRALLTAQ